MRSILTISLPEKEKKFILQRAKKAKQTVSSYILHAVRVEQEVIGEDQLLSMAKEARENYKSGKTTIYNLT